jgi:SynChlorMet cassette protein ScmD
LNFTDSPVLNPVVVLREEFDDWAVLFNPDSGAAAGINPMGVAIWKLIDGRRTVAAIIEDIVATSQEVPATAPEEIRAFVESLAKGGFVGMERPAPGP